MAIEQFLEQDVSEYRREKNRADYFRPGTPKSEFIPVKPFGLILMAARENTNSVPPASSSRAAAFDFRTLYPAGGGKLGGAWMAADA